MAGARPAPCAACCCRPRSPDSAAPSCWRCRAATGSRPPGSTARRRCPLPVGRPRQQGRPRHPPARWRPFSRRRRRGAAGGCARSRAWSAHLCRPPPGPDYRWQQAASPPPRQRRAVRLRQVAPTRRRALRPRARTTSPPGRPARPRQGRRTPAAARRRAVDPPGRRAHPGAADHRPRLAPPPLRRHRPGRPTAHPRPWADPRPARRQAAPGPAAGQRAGQAAPGSAGWPRPTGSGRPGPSRSRSAVVSTAADRPSTTGERRGGMATCC